MVLRHYKGSRGAGGMRQGLVKEGRVLKLVVEALLEVLDGVMEEDMVRDEAE